MGVVHHANYLRFFEEARVDWLRRHGLEQWHGPQADCLLAVVHSQVGYKRSLAFGDAFEVRLQLKRLGRLKLHFQYKICLIEGQAVVATGETQHVCLNNQLEVRRLPQAIIDQVEKEQWIETWL